MANKDKAGRKRLGEPFTTFLYKKFCINKIYSFCGSLKVESKDVSTTVLEALGVISEVKDKMNPEVNRKFFLFSLLDTSQVKNFSMERKSVTSATVSFTEALLLPALVPLCPCQLTKNPKLFQVHIMDFVKRKIMLETT